MGRVLEIVQWVLLILIIAYLVFGTEVAIRVYSSLYPDIREDIDEALAGERRRQSVVNRVEIEAKKCETKDDCAYGEYAYQSEEFHNLYAGCVNKDKLTSLEEVPDGLVCSCVDKKCVSIS